MHYISNVSPSTQTCVRVFSRFYTCLGNIWLAHCKQETLFIELRLYQI